VPEPGLAVSRGLLALGLLFLAAPHVLSQDAPAPGATPPPAPEIAPPAPSPPKILVTGFVDAYYLYDFNRADPALRSFDVQHNAFSLSLADVALAKAVTTDSRVGFRAELAFGKTADLIAAYEPEQGGQEIGKHVLQAYASVLAGSQLQIDAGKFLSPLGAEVVPSQDNWNYSRSVLFGYAIPFYHLGARATLPVGDKVTLAGYLVNGWNNSSEVDGHKTVGLGVTVKPSGRLTWVGNYMGGQETEGGGTRHIFDTTLTFAATPKLSLMGNFDYGRERDVSWWGLAAYAKVQVRLRWALVGRYEYLDDASGGFMTIGQRAQTMTLTSDHLIAGGLKLRLEYRGDFTDEPFFADDRGARKDSQHAVLVGLVCAFGGRI
jgi:hypothetical protein